MIRKENERKEKEKEGLQNQIQELNKSIDNLKGRLKTSYDERSNELLKKELETIRERFVYLGYGGGITSKIFKSVYKEFWFSMINRYLDLKEKLNFDSDDGMDMLLATIYSANGDLDEAYEQLKLYVQHENSQIYPNFFENVEIKSTNDMSEIIGILQEKIKHEPKGIVQDSYKETVDYLLKRKAKIEGDNNE